MHLRIDRANQIFAQNVYSRAQKFQSAWKKGQAFKHNNKVSTRIYTFKYPIGIPRHALIANI